MNIAIDGYEVNTTQRVGIGEYAYEIVSGMYEILSKRNQNTTNVKIYLPDSPRNLPAQTSWWEYKVRTPKKMWTFISLPMGLVVERPTPDVVFSPTHYVPRFTNIPRVMSIMDLSFHHFPELFRKKDLYQLTNWTEYSVKHAKAIFTISQFSRNAIIERYGFPEQNIFITYPGLRKTKMTVEKKIDVRSKYGIPKPFILSVGTIQPRKNYQKLIEAFSMFHSQNGFRDTQLVIVGKKGWLYEEILAAPAKYHVENAVKFVDFVSDQDLATLYKMAECFVMPSLYEGFGLPVLEAMANTCSIVVSNVSSIPEIAGEAGIYIDPNSTESILEGIQTAFEEKGTKKEAQRIRIGIERVSLFTWEKAAIQTLDVLEKVGNKAI